ncbi:ribonuclease P protein component [Frigoriflavimonas asaccharolytica]|uniref:Ribonuclease P protein component n=1 Tax=Frigoriflavimonas asaccharolytica TaxID=2735899 RepID=A0A8J8G9Z7_9FLAO|nr:ribonuclease P protein component [Frigoriflavimonas asaccharolytica]NRS93365.1 ribonuclease P protein component [Frigoriflavimonas asaccharolytica]
MKTQGYPKHEKLKGKDDTALLFKKGKWFSHGTLRIVFVKHGAESSPKFGVSVAKKLYKKAVDRNRIKRLLREVYRLNKDLYKDAFGNNKIAMLFYISPEKPLHYAEIEKAFLEFCEARKK